MHKNKSITLNGWISDYWEQGMERMPYLIFQDENFCKNRLEGWKYDGMHILKQGHKLTIFDDAGKILWDGILMSRKTGFFGCKVLQIDSYDWSPEDVEFETWKGWFKKNPPLKAKLTLSGEK